MNEWTDEELVSALRLRLEASRRACSDLTAMSRKLEQVNQRLQESEALKSHFLANIRNEITNPLTSILGLAGTLAAGQATERCVEFAGMIYAEADGLDAQLQNIIMAAELESGECLPEWGPIDVAGVLENLATRFAYRCREKRVTLSRRWPGQLVFVSDQQKLALIVGNLLANALEFSPAGAEVRLRAEVDGETLAMQVGDSGPGIPKENQERVFDRFCQLDTGSTKCHRGHGLGLSVARSLAQLLGGTLTLESPSGQGCLLTLALPAPLVGAASGERGTAGNLFLFDEAETF